MRSNLAERENQYTQLSAWDNPNYGLDEHWIHCFPYEQHMTAGEVVYLQVLFTNHSSEPHKTACRATFPRAWRLAATDFAWTIVLPGREGAVSLFWRVPDNALPGRYIVPVDVQYGEWFLPQATEAIIQVMK